MIIVHLLFIQLMKKEEEEEDVNKHSDQLQAIFDSDNQNKVKKKLIKRRERDKNGLRPQQHNSIVLYLSSW